MNTSINIHRLVPLFLVCLFLALIPSFFGWYLVIMIISIKAFLVICVIDYFRKTTINYTCIYYLDACFVFCESGKLTILFKWG